MIALLVLAFVLLFSSFVGWLIFRWRKGRFNVWVVFNSLLAAVLSLGCSLAAFLYYGLHYPGKDASYLHATNSAEIALKGPGETATIFVAFAKHTAVGEAFEIGVRVDGAPDGEQTLRIQAASSLGLQSLQKCSSDFAACARGKDSVLSVSWVVTPSETGRFITQIGLPEGLLPPALSGKDWQGFLKLDGRMVVKRAGREGTEGHLTTAERENWAHADFAGNSEKPFAINAASGRLALQSVALDLTRGEIGFETEVVRTLGVSEGSYTKLALAGAILASGLGSGWLISLFVWLRNMVRGFARRET